MNWIFSDIFKIRWSDIDMYEHLTSSAYIELAIEARASLFSEEIVACPQCLLISKNVNIEYKKPILYNDKLEIKLKVNSISSASFELLAVFFVGETAHAEVLTKLVTFDKEQNKLIKIPEEFRLKLSK